ncbi:non-ribosomal peptide synthetase [Lichenicoccus sp.]|uniref:non-ribosomal peptide synthetase n=1 Tax=Lichenicoccus sp. TaxID=2781899 RepID=UPI003D0CBE18
MSGEAELSHRVTRELPATELTYSVRAILLPNTIDPELLGISSAQVIGETEALQRCLAALPSIELLDFTAEPDPRAAAERWLLANAQGFAWTLIRLSAERMLLGQVCDPALLDPWAQDLVTARLLAVHAALAEGQTPPPVLAAHDQPDSDLDWCLAQFDDMPQAPSPSRLPPARALSSRRAVWRIEPRQAARLTAIARGLSITRPQLLCAAWAGLLSRVSYQDDLLLGLAVPGRWRGRASPPGHAVRLLPLRLRTHHDERFADLARRTARQMRAALRHQCVSRDALRQALGIAPGGPEPLSVVFNHLPRPAGIAAETASLAIGHLPVADLALSVETCIDGGLVLHLDCNRERHPADAAPRLLDRLRLVLDQMIRSGDRVSALRLDGLALMDDAERADVTRRFALGPPAPPLRTLVELLADPVRRHPLGPALVALSAGRRTSLSYAELDARSNRLARALLSDGLAAGDTAAVLLPRTAELVVALLACVKAGIAYCPLDPSQPSSRLAHLVQASRARRVLTDGAARLATDVPLLLLDDPVVRAATSDRVAAPIADCERAPLTPDMIAYVIFTSGSTGLPKGVAVSHGAISQQVQAYGAELTLGVGHSVISVFSVASDPSTLDVFAALSTGALLVFMDEAQQRDGTRIAHEASLHASPVLCAVPSLWRAIPLKNLPASLAAQSGSEPFPAELLPAMRRFRSLHNVYGPTETAVCCTMHRLGPNEEAGTMIPVGRPMAGYAIWILDQALAPVPVGALGELCVGGGALADGYVGQPAQTAAAFRPNPFGPGRIYRTGDLARWRPDGTIEVLGRIDGQIKILGHRIEPAEIEHALRKLHWVADAAILSQGDGRHTRLVAFFQPRPGERMPPPAEIRAVLGDRLPRWMLPAACVELAALPRTTNGKLDRRALTEATSPRAAPSRGRPPASPDEALLCSLFAKVTGHNDVDADSDFTDIGGDSLAAMVLVTELRQAGRELSLTRLYAGRTPAAIAAKWGTPGGAEPEARRPTLFLIPGAGGDNPRCAALRSDWADSLDCIIVEYSDWPRLIAPGFSMQDMIDDIARRILIRRPSQPLLLAGYSLGGVAAWGVAKRLARAGYPVDTLFIIDSNMNQLFEPPPTPAALGGRLANRLLATTSVLRGGDRARFSEMLAEVIAYRLVGRPALLRVVASLRAVRLPSRFRFSLHLSLTSVLQARLARGWQEGAPLDCRRIILFRAAEAEDDHAPPGLGWPERCTRLEVEQVAGGHLSLLSKRGPNSLHDKVAALLAEQIEATATSHHHTASSSITP